MPRRNPIGRGFHTVCLSFAQTGVGTLKTMQVTIDDLLAYRFRHVIAECILRLGRPKVERTPELVDRV
jgi:hypothetical protein